MVSTDYTVLMFKASTHKKVDIMIVFNMEGKFIDLSDLVKNLFVNLYIVLLYYAVKLFINF